MKKNKSFFSRINLLRDWFLSRSIYIKILTIIIILLLGYLSHLKFLSKKTNQSQYQTAKAEKGTLTIIVSASGQVLQANSALVETQASGVVSKVFVENGQQVKTGDKIAQIDLDLIGKQRSAQAWANYQNAKNSLETAKIAYYTLRSEMMTKWKNYMDAAQSATYQNPDGSPKTDTRQWPQFISTSDDWLAAEAKYKHQENVVAQAQTALNSAWLSYQQTSSTIYAPISGTVTGLSLQIGSVLTAQSNTSGTATSQKIASIQTKAPPVIQVNLSQIDTPKVKIGNKASLIFDAFPNKTFTGKVVSIDTIGSISSGVTTYSAMIKLDSEVPEIYSNMTASANIITQIKNNVLLIPSSAVQTQDEEPFVKMLKNGKIEQINIEIGLSTPTQVEVISGLSEGDTIITNISSTQQTPLQRSGRNQSPFGGFGGGVFRR